MAWPFERGAPFGSSSLGPCLPRMRSAADERLGFATPSFGATVFMSHDARDPSTTASNQLGVSPISLHHRSKSFLGWSVLPPPQQFDVDFHPQSNSDQGAS
jgi:hypothetical protein